MSRIQAYRYFRSKGLTLFDSLNFSELGDVLLAVIAAGLAITGATYFLYTHPGVLAWIWRI